MAAPSTLECGVSAKHYSPREGGDSPVTVRMADEVAEDDRPLNTPLPKRRHRVDDLAEIRTRLASAAVLHLSLRHTDSGREQCPAFNHDRGHRPRSRRPAEHRPVSARRCNPSSILRTRSRAVSESAPTARSGAGVGRVGWCGFFWGGEPRCGRLASRGWVVGTRLRGRRRVRRFRVVCSVAGFVWCG
jgi:hypothetical protein